MRRDAGLFIIIGYKLLRAVLALRASAVLFGFIWSNRAEERHALADRCGDTTRVAGVASSLRRSPPR